MVLNITCTVCTLIFAGHFFSNTSKSKIAENDKSGSPPLATALTFSKLKEIVQTTLSIDKIYEALAVLFFNSPVILYMLSILHFQRICVFVFVLK